MNKLIIKFIIYLSFCFSMQAFSAPIETFTFDSRETEKIFHKLSDELRCLVCQNQNIAESNAELAKDLRLEMYNLLSQGKTEDEIVEFMVKRYGDYVLYRPPFKPMTWLLWFGPLIVFVMGFIFVVRLLKSQASEKQSESLNEEEIERIKSLHAEQDNK